MTPKVVVLDYGSGNLRSAERALARVGADVTVTADLAAAAECDGLVVPGVGAFAACMAGIRGIGGEKVIASRIEAGRPVLGICVGMQVLFAEGVEFGLFQGIPDDTRFYFVHSFALRMRDAAPLLAAGAKITVTEHGEPFAAAVEQGVLAATQFHPEKSGDAGATVLSNWLAAL
jgi:imidazole glycerol-phosphate synthase subunit HisH